jgi:outer membrane protein OmpA-like peptidoglycan-associated protein
MQTESAVIGRYALLPLVAAVLLVGTGCATKGFVREEVQKSEKKAEQQIGKLESDLVEEKGRVSGVLVQVGDVRSLADAARARGDEAFTRADQASSRAERAGGLAGQALVRADDADSRLTRLWGNRYKRNLLETHAVTFGFNRWELDDRGQTALLDVAKQLKENPNLFVDLSGFTDNTGPAPYNLQLSQRRVEAVRRFLAEKGVELHRIQSIGLGHRQPVADNRTREGRAQNRRVVIQVFAPSE